MKPHLPGWVSTQEEDDTGWFREGQSCVDGAGGKYLQVLPVCHLQSAEEKGSCPLGRG